jgi:serine/threonine protein kinase
MALAAGTKLGPYEIVAPIGAGGMGEVYRARDTKLQREVAIKVLPEIFANDPDRTARFAREALLLASLNHPGIAQIYGVEDRALVMELVPGPTLAERISSGAILLDEALPLAAQIVEAVEYAHDHNVVHRDLKPANVKITPEGTVKVLDFGLAKALADEPDSSDPRNSPTLTMTATRLGVVLGTAAYMAPEQAKGKPVDRRADIWAFGVVFYEMLTGKPMHQGETVAETMASVIMKEARLEGLPADTPSAIKTLLRRCVEKDPKQRLQSIGEARIVLRNPIPAPTDSCPSPFRHRPVDLWLGSPLPRCLQQPLPSRCGRRGVSRWPLRPCASKYRRPKKPYSRFLRRRWSPRMAACSPLSPMWMVAPSARCGFADSTRSKHGLSRVLRTPWALYSGRPIAGRLRLVAGRRR